MSKNNSILNSTTNYNCDTPLTVKSVGEPDNIFTVDCCHRDLFLERIESYCCEVVNDTIETYFGFNDFQTIHNDILYAETQSQPPEPHEPADISEPTARLEPATPEPATPPISPNEMNAQIAYGEAEPEPEPASQTTAADHPTFPKTLDNQAVYRAINDYRDNDNSKGLFDVMGNIFLDFVQFMPSPGKYEKEDYITLFNNALPKAKHFPELSPIVRAYEAGKREIEQGIPSLQESQLMDDFSGKTEQALKSGIATKAIADHFRRLAAAVEVEVGDNHLSIFNQPDLDYDYFTQDFPDTKYIVGNLITENSLDIVYGQYGSLKTMLLQWLALHVAIGKPVNGLETLQQNVLWLDYDTGQDELAKRVKAMINSTGIRFTPQEFNLKSMTDPRIDFSSDEMTDQLIADCNNRKVQWVIIDNLSNVCGGMDMNSPAMSQVMTNLRRLQQAVGKITIIAHPNKAGSLANNQTIINLADNSFKVEREIEINPDEKSRKIIIGQEKVRTAPVPPMGFEFNCEKYAKEDGTPSHDMRLASFTRLDKKIVKTPDVGIQVGQAILSILSSNNGCEKWANIKTELENMNLGAYATWARAKKKLLYSSKITEYKEKGSNSLVLELTKDIL